MSRQVTTVHDVLERLGKPPLEICLDWAWQLERLANAQSTQTPHPPGTLSSPNRSDTHEPKRNAVEAVKEGSDLWLADDSHDDDQSGACDWSQLTVDDNGLLHGLSAPASNPVKRTCCNSARLAQLLRWSATADSQQADQAVAAPQSPLTIQTQLQQRTLQWSLAHATTGEPATNTTPAIKCMPHSKQTVSRGQVRHTLRTATATIAAGGLLLAVATTFIRRSPSTTTTNSASAPRVASASQAAPASIFEATAQQGLATPPRRSETAQTNDVSAGTTSAVPLGVSSAATTAQLSGQHAAPQSLALSTDSIVAPDPLTASNGRAPDPLLSMQRSAIGPIDSSSNQAPTGISEIPPSQTITGLNRDPSDSKEAMDVQAAADAIRPADIDVLADLAALSKSAESTTSEVKVPSPEPPAPKSATEPAAPSETASSPILLQSFPMIQLQEFDKRLRPRQPQWRLRLAASEGLEVQPSVAQELSEEQMVSWTINAAEPIQPQSKNPRPLFTRGDSGTTRIVVQVQLPSKRETSLRWRVVAISDDYPQMAVPLDRAWLDRFQEYLSRYIAGLQQESQQMKELVRTAGLPSQTRSGLSTRSRALDSERKLAAELLEIVADANQMVGWLDGQIEVHGELLDTSANPPTALLQFGNP